MDYASDPNICNNCHDLMQKTMSFNYSLIASNKGNEYRMYF